MTIKLSIFALLLFLIAACTPFATPTPELQEPLRSEIGGHKIIVTSIAESLENLQQQANARGYQVIEGERKCFHKGQTLPIDFEIPDAYVENNLYVFGHADGEVAAITSEPKVYGVFIRYAKTGKWGFLPVFYYTGEKQGDCAFFVRLTLKGPTSTIPAERPE